MLLVDISELANEKDKVHRDILGPVPVTRVEIGTRLDQGSYDDDIYSIKREMESVLEIIIYSIEYFLMSSSA